MSLPEQLQKQVTAAQATLEQHYGPPAGNEPQATLNADEEQKPETQPQAQEDVTKPAADVTQQPGESDESYAQRWRSLQGIYNAQQAQLRAAVQRTSELERLISTMASSNQTPPRQQQHQPEAPKFLTEKDSEEFGKDMVDFARRAAQEEMAPLVGAIQQLRQEVISLKSGVVPAIRHVTANQNRSAEERFFERLAERVPNWQEINGNGRFHEWLLTPDPMTDITRQTYLEDAQKSLNLDRVVNIFQQWATATGTLAETQQRQPQGRPNAAASELERQVAPGKATAGTTPPQKQQRTWSPEQITKFYNDVTRGVYKGKPEEKEQLERDLFLAQREGRIAPNA